MYCTKTVWPLIEELLALADQIELKIERHERGGLTSPGFATEEFGCDDDAVRLMNGFSNCKLWAAANDIEAVVSLHGEALAAKAVCAAG